MNSGAVRERKICGPTGLAAHILDVATNAVIRAIAFATDLLVPAQDRFAATDIDDDVAVFLALDDAVDDRAGAVLEFLELTVTLGFADLLQDHLLGRLRGDPAHLDRRNLVDERVADLGVVQKLLGLLDGQLGLVVLKLLHPRPRCGPG